MRRSIITVDLGFGDAGKGSMVDFLCRQMQNPTVVKYTGGAQCAHNVVTREGKHHTFAQFGSGTLSSDGLPRSTHLGPRCMLDLAALSKEANALQKLVQWDPYVFLTVDERVRLTTRYHKAANRIRESLRDKKHGTCGMGIGETASDELLFPDTVIRAADLKDWNVLVKKLLAQQQVKVEEFAPHIAGVDHFSDQVKDDVKVLRDPESPKKLADAMFELGRKIRVVNPKFLRSIARRGEMIFEGAQGVLLDEWRGFHPHTTWNITTTENALALLKEIEYDYPVETIGIMRSYQTRHGAGPLPTYDEKLTRELTEQHNDSSGWQGAWRVGWLDLVLARYALDVCPVDSLAITHVDRSPGTKVCTAYEFDKPTPMRGNHLKVNPVKMDLSYQETQGLFLSIAKPYYVDFPEAVVDRMFAIGDYLKRKVSILSAGTTADLKTVFA